MSRRLVLLLVVLSVLSILGILGTQAWWVFRAYDLHQRQFRQSATVALQAVAVAVARQNHVVLDRFAVVQLAPDYFVVNTNAPIEPITLERLIEQQLQQQQLVTAFEYGIYDCQTDQMVYANFVNTTARAEPTCNLPKFPGYVYYFGIRFPEANSWRTTATPTDPMVWTTGAVLVVVVFFGYTLVMLLQQRQLTEVQRAFINNVTHELQTPVSTLQIAANVLQSADIQHQPDRLRQYARIVGDESRRLQRQIGAVLTLARADHLPTRPVRERLDLHQLLHDVAAHYPGKVQVSPGAPDAMLSADHYHLENVLNNLIDNGLKYNQSAQPMVTLTTTVTDGRLAWSVSDNGIGIAPAHQRAVFRQFWRVPMGHVQAAGGFGLGLYYVQQTIRAHGWRLRLTSELGQGTQITILTNQRVSAGSAIGPPQMNLMPNLPI